MLSAGGYEVYVFISDRFALDGGSMFGAVPKTLWGREVASDTLNRMQLCCRMLVLKGHGRLVLVDLGCGRKWSAKEYDIYKIEHTTAAQLHEVFADATDVILTHLHFDHAGGAVYTGADGMPHLSFPGAVHHIQERNFRHAQTPSVREKASYLRVNLEPLSRAKLNLISGPAELLPGLRVFEANGHTHGQQWVLVGQGRGALAFPSDMLPSAHHIHLPYITAFDLSVEQTIEEKREFLEQALEHEWTVVFYHDLQTPAAKIRRDNYGRFRLGTAVEIPQYYV